MKKIKIITVGGMTEDVFFSVDDFRVTKESKAPGARKMLAFEYGGKVGISDLKLSCGGGAANAAVCFARLGFKASIIGDVGSDDRGKRILRNFRRNGVDAKLVARNNHLQSGVSYILVTPNREHIVFTYRGANGASVISHREMAAIKKAEWTYLTSLSGQWKKVASPVFASASRIAWNPGRDQIAAGLKALSPFLKKTGVLLCNRSEARSLVSSATRKSAAKKTASSDLPSLLKTLHSAGPRIVVITDGAKGASAFDGTTYFSQKALRVAQPLNTTGVGDAFGSSFVAGLELYEGNIKKALDLAARNSASVVAAYGAQAGLLEL